MLVADAELSALLSEQLLADLSSDDHLKLRLPGLAGTRSGFFVFELFVCSVFRGSC